MANIIVRRANVVLDIPEFQKAEYLAKGFDVIGPNGKIIERTTPNDINSLKKSFNELTEKVKELEKENAKLKEQLASKKKKVEKVEEPEVNPVEEEKPKKEFTPINKRGKKSK